MTIEPLSVEFQHTLIFQAWDCLIGNAKVTYISGPITTGLRWAEALESGADAGKPVINANCAAIRQAADQMRREAGVLVLEPASLHVETWSQDDYLALWTTLIERHASSVAFVGGWPYSIGCALEFERAVIHCIPTSSVNGAPIDLNDGIELLMQAASALKKKSHSIPKVAYISRRLLEVAERLRAQST